MWVFLCDVQRIRFLFLGAACTLAQLFWLVLNLLFETFCSYYTSGILWFIDVHVDSFELLQTKMPSWNLSIFILYVVTPLELLNLKLFSVGRGEKWSWFLRSWTSSALPKTTPTSCPQPLYLLVAPLGDEVLGTAPFLCTATWGFCRPYRC